MHFRKLTAIVFKEFTSHVLGKEPNNVVEEDITWYATNIRNTYSRGGLNDTVQCIFYVLFDATPKSTHAADLVGGWIRRTSPLLNTLFKTTRPVQNKPTSLTQSDFHPYNIQEDNWKVRSHCPPFKPNKSTIDEMLSVMQQYDYPVYPLSVRGTVRHREPVTDWCLLSPPRRTRKTEVYKPIMLFFEKFFEVTHCIIGFSTYSWRHMCMQ
jgi:hypothetical protein